MQSITEKLGAPPVLPSVKKSHDMIDLELKITVISPMAGGGVKAGVVDIQRPVRVPSVRGHLRYWWRMMNRNIDSEELAKREAEIWGSTESPGKIYADISEQPNISFRYSNNNFDFPNKYGPEVYALFASRQNGDDIAREGFSFTLRFNYCKEFHNDIILALSAWIYFGGIGARTRRGCGSLYCDKVPLSLNEVLKAAPYITLWTKKTNDNKPLSAWSYALKCYRDYRQNRNRGEGNRPGRSKWPEADSLRSLTGRYPTRHAPRNYLPLPSFPRAALGMPIIFQFSPRDRREEPDGVQITPNIKDSSRMASPVITKALCEKGIWYSAVIILPHDDIFRTNLKLTTGLHVNDTTIIPMRSNEYNNLDAAMRQPDAISGFEKYIRGDFKDFRLRKEKP